MGPLDSRPYKGNNKDIPDLTRMLYHFLLNELIKGVKRMDTYNHDYRVSGWEFDRHLSVKDDGKQYMERYLINIYEESKIFTIWWD